MPVVSTLHEDIITIASASADIALYASAKPVLWAEVLQHPDYGDVKISLGAASVPTVTREVDLGIVPNTGATGPTMHDLATINVRAHADGDKLVVRYETLAYTANS